MRKSLCLLLMTAIALNIYAQDFSNKGKDFWICYPAHIDGTSSAMGIYITSDGNATGQITLGSTIIPFSLTANTVVRKFLGPNGSGDASNLGVYLNQDDGIHSGAGIHVTSDRPVVVYAHIIRTARSGATLVLPVKVWGREYIAPSYRNVATGGGGNGGIGELAIMASSPNTVVEITPTVASRSGSRPANVPFTITIPNAGDVYQLQFTQNADISGTIVRSIATSTGGCKPIAVFSATTWSGFDCAGSSGGDNLFQQLFPTGAWGKKFITAPFITRSYDIIRVFIKTPGTVVTKMENGVLSFLTGLSPQGYYEFKTNHPTVLQADEPISVVQYMTSQTCSANCNNNCTTPADPEMVVINPIEQTVNNITVFSAHKNFVPPTQSGIENCYLNIILPNAGIPSFKINGQAPSGSFNQIPGTVYSYLQENVTVISQSNPVQTLSCDSNFIAIAYGYGQVESYGYNAGTNVIDLYQYVTIQNEYATVNFPAGCRNSPLRFAMTLPYQPLEIKWVFGSSLNGMGLADTTINAPVFDSTWTINGRSLYRYKLNRVTTIPTAGTYPIKVVANNPTADGCSGEQEIEYDLQIFDRPSASFTTTNNGCLSDSVAFFDKTNGQGRPVVQWSWDFADGGTSTVKNPKHKYNAAGPYDVRFAAITDVGCISDTTHQTISIANPPIADFQFSNTACVNRSISFTDQSNSLGSTLAKWKWDFGDGNILDATNGNPVSHSYGSALPYDVKLSVQTSSGCWSTISVKRVVVHPNPVVNFQLPAVVCLPQGAQFNDLSTISDGTAAAFIYQWDFDDGGTSNIKNPVHTYANVGPFNVKLLVSSNNGCTESTTKSFNTVYAQPKAGFTVTPEVCLGNPTTFSDQSNGNGSTITSWRWVFGDGQTDTSRNPMHIYPLATAYQPKLYVFSDKGCVSDTAFNPTLVNPLPAADFAFANPTCETQTINFNDASNANAGVVSKWNWVFGDGGTAITQNPVHQFRSVNSYMVSLNVETNKGCKSSVVSKTVDVHYLPIPGFGMPEVCLSDPIAQFSDSSRIADNTSSQFTYNWNFGDPYSNATNPNTSTQKNPQHHYSKDSIYAVKLTITSKDGCTKDTVQQFVVNGAVPKAGFTLSNPNILCSNKDVALVENSTVNFGSIVKVEIYWDYMNDPTKKTVDDNPTSGKTYTYKYPEFGTPAAQTYQIRYIAYSGINCLDPVVRNVTILASPQIQFDAMSGVCQEIAPFQVTTAKETSGLPGSGSFTGAGINSSGIFNPAIAKAGAHTLRYTFTGTNGCVAFKEQPISVYPTPTLDLGPDRVVLEGGFITITPKVSGSNLTYVWTPATGLDHDNRPSPKVSPPYDITYQLTVTSSDGCGASDQVFVKILKQVKVPNAFSPNNDGINDKWEIQYLESYPGCTIEVYNRYGQPVFSSVGYEKPWDGTFKGAALPVATYYWIINPKNGREVLKGSVTIIR